MSDKNQEKNILVLKSYHEGEGSWEVNIVPEEIISALLPTDIEMYLNTELRLEKISQAESDKITLNGYRYQEGMSKPAAKAELVRELQEEVDLILMRIAMIQEIPVIEEEQKDYEEELELDKEENESRN